MATWEEAHALRLQLEAQMHAVGYSPSAHDSVPYERQVVVSHVSAELARAIYAEAHAE